MCTDQLCEPEQTALSLRFTFLNCKMEGPSREIVKQYRNDVIRRNYLAQGLVYGKHLTNSSYYSTIHNGLKLWTRHKGSY